MHKKLNITNGATFQYFYLGLVFAIISIILLFSDDYFIVGILTLPIAVFTFLSIRGSLIDFENKKIKSYWNIVFIKIGNWQNLEKFTRVELLLNSQSQQMNYRSVSTNVSVRSYYISLTNQNKDRIELKEFTDYAKAQEFLISVGKKLGIETVNRKEIIENRNVTK